MTVFFILSNKHDLFNSLLIDNSILCHVLILKFQTHLKSVKTYSVKDKIGDNKQYFEL